MIPKSIILVFVGVLSSCITLYKPNAIYSPMLHDKGDGNISASVGLSGSGIVNVQSSYALSNHYGLMMDGMYHYRRSTTETSTEKLDLYSAELGCGYFSKLGKSNNTCFQSYLGIGNGKSVDKIYNTDGTLPTAKAQYVNFFIQPGFYFLYSQSELALDIRANYVHLYHINAYLYDKFEWWNTDYQYAQNSSLSFMNLEPTLTYRIGRKSLQTILQLGLTIPTINSKNYFNINNASLLVFPLIKLNVGIRYTFKNYASR